MLTSRSSKPHIKKKAPPGAFFLPFIEISDGTWYNSPDNEKEISEVRILIVRHGDPNYEIDGLTEGGRLEAEALARRMKNENITAAYCSPLGRARLTAEPTLAALGMTAEYCEWLREFNYATVKPPYEDGEVIAWDLLPAFVNGCDKLYSTTRWREEEFIRTSDMPRHYDAVCRELDAMLARHGYVRDGYNYRAVRPNHDTLLLVCHYGITAVLLSHLMNSSPYVFWQNAVTLPTSVTTVYTEEREEGVASMRVAGIGDLSHLYAAGIEPSFSARFCECFTDDTRHGGDPNKK